MILVEQGTCETSEIIRGKKRNLQLSTCKILHYVQPTCSLKDLHFFLHRQCTNTPIVNTYARDTVDTCTCMCILTPKHR